MTHDYCQKSHWRIKPRVHTHPVLCKPQGWAEIPPPALETSGDGSILQARLGFVLLPAVPSCWGGTVGVTGAVGPLQLLPSSPAALRDNLVTHLKLNVVYPTPCGASSSSLPALGKQLCVFPGVSRCCFSVKTRKTRLWLHQLSAQGVLVSPRAELNPAVALDW